MRGSSRTKCSLQRTANKTTNNRALWLYASHEVCWAPCEQRCTPAEEPTKQTSMPREWCTQAHTASTSLTSCAPVTVLRPVLEPTPRMSNVTTGSPLSAMRTAIPRKRALQPPNFEYWCTRTTAHARFNRTFGSLLHNEHTRCNMATRTLR